MEMDESVKNPNQQSYWQEMGRWVGFEETYDVEAGRWGPSHVSYLTFKSLVQIRRTMNTGEGMPEVITGSNLSSDLLSVDCKALRLPDII